jgi:hypothetical protein
MLTDNPENADIILLCDLRFDNYYQIISKNEILKKHINKCFLLSNFDRPITHIRGVYTSAEKSFFNFGRIRSCSYTASYDPYRNSFISNHDPNFKKNKTFFFSFLGRNCDISRDKIFGMDFARKDLYLEETSKTYDLYQRNHRDLILQKKFYETLLSSKFSLCPRGWGANSYRLFESMMLGVSPIIISDEWVLPKGPRWEDFSILIKVKDIANLEQVVSRYEHKYLQMGQAARQAYLQFFDEKVYFNYVLENCLQIRSCQVIPESFHYKLLLVRIFFLQMKVRLKKVLKKLFLKSF